ncbi:MAG: DUF1028 domain-containing protein [Candidatus Melainabacteria bacterium]|nr:DUF1028 domain-containing protein [Candidatus Melainabacteria bacterium]
MTFTIIALDRKSGELALASASCGLFTGNIVPFHSKDGYVLGACQAYPSRSLKKRILELVERGLSMTEIENALELLDRYIQYRQVGFLGRDGRHLIFTGNQVTEGAGHLLGKDFLILGNMLANAESLKAMAAAFEAEPEAALAYRLIKSLEACKKAGGQSLEGRSLRERAACLLVIDRTANISLDIRVNMSQDAVEELRRQYVTFKIYDGFMGICQDEPRNLPVLSAQESLMPFAPGIFD